MLKSLHMIKNRDIYIYKKKELGRDEMSYVMFFPTAATLLQIEFDFESEYITDILP